MVMEKAEEREEGWMEERRRGEAEGCSAEVIRLDSREALSLGVNKLVGLTIGAGSAETAQLVCTRLDGT